MGKINRLEFIPNSPCERARERKYEKSVHLLRRSQSYPLTWRSLSTAKRTSLIIIIRTRIRIPRPVYDRIRRDKISDRDFCFYAGVSFECRRDYRIRCPALTRDGISSISVAAAQKIFIWCLLRKRIHLARTAITDGICACGNQFLSPPAS